MPLPPPMRATSSNSFSGGRYISIPQYKVVQLTLVREFHDRSLERKGVSDLPSRHSEVNLATISEISHLHFVNVLACVAIVVLLHQKNKLTLLVGGRDWGVRTDDRFTLCILEIIRVRGFHDEARCDGKERSFVVGQLKHKPVRQRNDSSTGET
jgi:hypothetical protein